MEIQRVLQNSKFTYLSNVTPCFFVKKTFCRIQNLHISQTSDGKTAWEAVFCRIQNLHISQTLRLFIKSSTSFVEFKIHISLKRINIQELLRRFLQNSKFTYLSNSAPSRTIHFIFCRIQNSHISQTDFPTCIFTRVFCRIQNSHISQTVIRYTHYKYNFVEFKIHISLKLYMYQQTSLKILQNSKFTYLSNNL